VRTTTVEHETDDKPQARGSESQRKDGARPVAETSNGPLHAGLLLRLQAMAGNAAVASLIATRTPEPTVMLEPSPPGVPAMTNEAPAEAATAAAPAGPGDDELAAIDAAADAPPVAGQPVAEDAREQVAHDAQAELADQPESSDAPLEVSEGPGGVPIEARPAPVALDLSSAQPATGLARAGSLPPAQLLSSLASVSTAADLDAANEHKRLAANAPQRARHPGAPSTVESPASARVALLDAPAASIPAMPEYRDVAIRRPPALPAAPTLPVGNGQLPTRDPGLELKPGPIPQLSLEGNADPASVQQHRTRLLGSLERDSAANRQEAGRPLGEDEIFPTAPAEMLHGSLGEMPGGAGQGAAQPTASEDDEAASVIAQQEKSSEIQGAVGTGLASLAGQRQEYDQRTAAERVRADAEMTHLEQANAQEQAGERGAARGEVLGLRRQWTTAQRDLMAGAQREADAKTSETMQAVAQERGAAEAQAAAHYEQGQQESQKARREAEHQAASEKQKAQSQGQSGLLGAIGSAAQSSRRTQW